MGDSDYGAAMPEALEKPPPPPEVQTLASPADKVDTKTVEPTKANGDGDKLAETDMSCNSTAEANNNINNESPAGDSAKSNGDVGHKTESRHSHDDSVDHQSELDLRLNESAESFMELDEISSEASAPLPESADNASEGPSRSDGSHSNTLTTTDCPPEQLAPATQTGGQEVETPEAAREGPAAEVSVTENESAVGAPEVSSLVSQTPQTEAGPLSPPRVSGTGESTATGTSSTASPSMTSSVAPNRSTSPEIGEGAEKAGEYERAPSEDVVTIVVMEKNDEEEPSEEEASHESQAPEGDTTPPEGSGDSAEPGAPGQPAIKLVEVEDDPESDEQAGEKLNQESGGQTDNEATPVPATAPVDSDSSSREAEQAESSFLILGSDQSSGESGGEESSRTKENGDVGEAETKPATSTTSTVKVSASGGGDQPRRKSHPSPEEMNDERFAEIESLVAAFDRPEDEGGEREPGQTEGALKEEGGNVSLGGTPTVLLGKVQKKRGRKSKEEKERLERLAGLLKAETDEGKSKAPKSGPVAGVRVKPERLIETKLRKCEQKKSATEPDAEMGQSDDLKEGKIQKARRTGGAPTKKEAHRTELAVAAASQPEAGVDATPLGQRETLTVVGNGKLRVHGYDRVNPQTGLPELVTVNREALEKVISEQNSQMQRMKAKLKEMYKVCDDLRKVVLTKGLQEAVLTPEEAAIPVDVTIRMAKLPPKGLQTGQSAIAHGEPTAKMKTCKVTKRGGLVDAGVRSASPTVAGASQTSPVKVAQVGYLQAKGDTPRLAKVAMRDETSAATNSAQSQVVDVVSVGGGDGKSDRVDVEDSLIERARDLVDALPKDIVRALTNGDVLTAQQRQRFIDKITMDIMKAKGVPQPKQIQEIALQVANMYPRSLVILPEGKRKSNLRRKRGETDDGDLDEPSEPSVAKKPRISQGAASVASSPAPSSATGSEQLAATAGKTPVKMAFTSPSADGTPVPKRRGRPPKNPQDAPATSQQQELLPQASVSSPPRKVNGGAASPVAGAAFAAKKRGRPKKEVAAPAVTVASAEELSMTPDEQKAWLREDLQRAAKEQDRAKQDRLLHNCYNLLYKEMAQKDYDVMYITEQWPALREPHHVLSIFKRLKKVHGEFQDQMRRDAPKLVTFLHERVTSEEGAELSLAISQAKPGPRYQLPEEVGVMPLLALNFDEDFSLLFKLAPDEAGLQTLLSGVGPQPIIVGLGSSIFSCEYRIVIERQQFFTPPPTTFLDALELVYAAYFVFNFAYPRELSNTLEYVQRYYVGYNPHIKMVTLANSRPRIANFIKKMKDFERLDWNANNIRANSPGVPSEFERESDSEEDDNEDTKTEKMVVDRPPTDKNRDVDNERNNDRDGGETEGLLQADSKQQSSHQNVHDNRAEPHFANPQSPRQQLDTASTTAIATNISHSNSNAHTSQRAK